MSLTDQLQSVLSAVATLEQAAAAQAQQVQTLSAQVSSLSADNAALRAKLNVGAATPPPEDDASAAATQWGFVANEADPIAALRLALPRLQADGGTWLRLWHSSFSPISAATTALINLAADVGVKVILCVQPKDTTPASLGTPDFTTFVARNASVLKKLAFVEAGNELNLTQYRPDDLGSSVTWPANYVSRWLRPLSAALKMIQVKTMCTCVTETQHTERYIPEYAALLAAGAGDCCDAVALHAYVEPAALATVAAAVAAIRQSWNKPVHVTEANVYTRGLSSAQWNDQLTPYLAMLKAAGVASVCFYRGFAKSNGKWSWPVLFNDHGTPTDAYGLLLAAMKA